MQDATIQGIGIDRQEHRISQFSDDEFLFLASFAGVQYIFNRFLPLFEKSTAIKVVNQLEGSRK